jgi:hypothetical protein
VLHLLRGPVPTTLLTIQTKRKKEMMMAARRGMYNRKPSTRQLPVSSTR